MCIHVRPVGDIIPVDPNGSRRLVAFVLQVVHSIVRTDRAGGHDLFGIRIADDFADIRIEFRQHVG